MVHFVFDGEEEASTEPVVPGAALAFGDDASFDEDGRGDIFLAGPVGEALEVEGAVADVEGIDGGFEVAFAEVVAGGGSVGGVEELVAVVAGNFGEGDGDGITELGFLGVGAVAGIQFHGEAGALGEEAGGLDEVDVFLLHDEAEDVAASAATEAMEALAIGVYIEGWGFLVMKGAETEKASGAALELDVGADDVDDVAGIADFLDVFLEVPVIHGRLLSGGEPVGGYSSSSQGMSRSRSRFHSWSRRSM